MVTHSVGAHLAQIVSATKALDEPGSIMDVRHERAGEMEQADLKNMPTSRKPQSG